MKWNLYTDLSSNCEGQVWFWVMIFGVIGPLWIKKKRKDGLQKCDNFSVFIIIIWCCQKTQKKFKGLCQPNIDSNVIYTGNIRVH